MKVGMQKIMSFEHNCLTGVCGINLYKGVRKGETEGELGTRVHGLR